MKNKVLPAIGVLFGLTILFSACSDDNSSAPSATIATPNISSSSNEESVPASSAEAIPQSSETQPQSSESLESSSSSVFLPSSGSWFDGGDYNPAACCMDTVYIENGKEKFHKLAEGVCPPPSIMTVTCVQPVRINLDSIKAAQENKKVSAIWTEDCRSLVELLKMGLSDDVKKAKQIHEENGSLKIEFWKNDYCSIDADLSYELSGDTLSVNLAEVRSAEECECFSWHRIDVPDTLQDFTYFKFEDRVYGLQ